MPCFVYVRRKPATTDTPPPNGALWGGGRSPPQWGGKQGGSILADFNKNDNDQTLTDWCAYVIHGTIQEAGQRPVQGDKRGRPISYILLPCHRSKGAGQTQSSAGVGWGAAGPWWIFLNRSPKQSGRLLQLLFDYCVHECGADLYEAPTLFSAQEGGGITPCGSREFSKVAGVTDSSLLFASLGASVLGKFGLPAG